jgi:hypothetical protein
LVFKTHLHAGLKRSVGSYEEYHWCSFEVEIHDCIEDSTHVFKYGYTQWKCTFCRHLELALHIEKNGGQFDSAWENEFVVLVAVDSKKYS